MAKPFPESLPDDPENGPEHISTCQDDHFRDLDLRTSLHRFLDMQAVRGGEYRTRLVNEIVFFSAAAGSVGGVEVTWGN